MARKLTKYGVLVIIIGLLAYNSVYIKKLSEVQAKEPVAFNAASFAQQLWEKQLPARLDSAITLDSLAAALKGDPARAFDKYFNSLSIGNIRYGLVKITGKVLSVNEDDVTVVATGGNGNAQTVTIATEYVYGNAIRDASRLVDIKDFVNTTDLNNISEELNKKVRTTVLPVFKTTVKKGDNIACTGAIELNQAHYTLDGLEIIPVQYKIIQQ
jgi:predicted lipoprotein